MTQITHRVRQLADEAGDKADLRVTAPGLVSVTVGNQLRLNRLTHLPGCQLPSEEARSSTDGACKARAPHAALQHCRLRFCTVQLSACYAAVAAVAICACETLLAELPGRWWQIADKPAAEANVSYKN